MATSAPSSARARAMARPMPREPPVTRAVRPVSFMWRDLPESGRECSTVACAPLWGLTRGVKLRASSAAGEAGGRANMAYVVKRYSNRKLYDTQESRYVTLDEIEEMIRAGKEIAVVDAASGEDLTSVTLTQIILEAERSHRGNLPT